MRASDLREKYTPISNALMDGIPSHHATGLHVSSADAICKSTDHKEREDVTEILKNMAVTLCMSRVNLCDTTT